MAFPDMMFFPGMKTVGFVVVVGLRTVIVVFGVGIMLLICWAGRSLLVVPFDTCWLAIEKQTQRQRAREQENKKAFV
jgi:hypothetical protein